MELSQNKKLRAFLDYLPAVVGGIATIVTIVLYFTIAPLQLGTVVFDLFFILVLPFVVIFLNRKLSVGFPYYLIVLMCLHLVVSVDMGTAMSLYWKIWWWDTAVHCFFGFLAGAMLYYFYIWLKHEKPGIIDCIAIVLIVLAFAALWEVFEFVMSGILEQDMQDVARLLSEGKNPLLDTVVDMLVATIGAPVFFPVRYFVGKLYNKIAKKDTKSEEQREDDPNRS